MLTRIPMTALLAGALLAASPPASSGASSSGGAPAAAPRATEADAFRQKTVMIEVERRDESGTIESEGGSGVVVCFLDRTAYVLTAQHVIYGTSSTGRRRSLLDLAGLHIRFYQGFLHPVDEVYKSLDLDDGETGEETDEKAAHSAIGKTVVRDRQSGKDLDLMILSFEPDGELSPARPGSLPLDTQGFDTPEWRDREVTAVGWPIQKDRAETWAERTGVVKRRDGDTLVHTAAISDGFSGGPLFDDAGALIGINLSVKEEGRAQAIDSVLAAIKLSLPAECSEDWGFGPREDKIKEAADGYYRAALLAIHRRDWRAAVESLETAILSNDSEGGSVHLQGMRYTEYLPHYHLGLALYRRGLEGDYGRALRELRASEVLGAIRDDKRRYGHLRDLKKRCKEAIDEQNLRKVKPAEGPRS